MAFPNVSDIIATTIESRTRKIADNVTKNNALLMRLSQKGKQRTFSGGRLIYEELSFAENGNAGWYSGYDRRHSSISSRLHVRSWFLAWKCCRMPAPNR